MLRKIAFVFPLLIIACSKKDQPAPQVPTGPVTQKEINNWVLDSMKYFYLWNDQLPATADTVLTTTAFFNQIKSSADRFSFLYKPADRSTYPKYMLYIYGIDFAVIEGNLGVIKLVLPNSMAAQNGLKRGSTFTQINGVTINSSNAATLSEQLLNAASASLTLTDGRIVTLTAQSLSENPVYLSNTRQVAGKTVAYLFYNYFDDKYNDAIETVFQQFKAAAAEELILDLRYNPGGSVAAAAMINALIAPGINENTVFAKYSGNKRLGQRNISYKDALSVPESGAPISFSSLSGLSLKRVFILTGSQTASAAELTINSLKPYTSVIQIGQSTLGKDKGAVIISDMRSPQRIPWTMLPITYNLLNAKGEGGYTTGITPQYIKDEMAVQPLLPVGDNDDPLIASAIAIINGSGRLTENERSVKRYYDTKGDQRIVTIPASFTR